MKYQVTYKCGHSGEINVYGPMADRDRKAAWVAQHDCPECERKEREAARAEATAKAAEATADLPALVGSDKQIAWATTIRAEKLDMIAKAGIKEEYLAAVRGVLGAETDCRWWIDHRFDDAQNLMMAKKDAIMALRK